MPSRTRSAGTIPKVPAAQPKVATGAPKVASTTENKGWVRAAVSKPKPQPTGDPGPGLRIADIKDPALQKAAAGLIDQAGKSGRDGILSQQELDAAVRRADPALMRKLEKAFGAEAVKALKTGADLSTLLTSQVSAPGRVSGDLPGPSPRYDLLFHGPKSEWVVAFGGDTHHASSEKAPPDVSQYRGFKSFLERQGFKQENRQAGIDETGFATYSKTIKAPDGHDHQLTVKVFNTSQFEGAADEFLKTGAERRGYFSVSHAGEGLGMRIGGQFIRPEHLLKTEAPGIIIAPIACKSFEHFGSKVEKYLDQNRIPMEKLTFLGTSQEIEMTQADGAMAILKQAFSGALAAKNGPTILKAADDAYNPIMASYDPSAYEANRDRMVMDSEIRATPVLRGLVAGQMVELPKKS